MEDLPVPQLTELANAGDREAQFKLSLEYLLPAETKNYPEGLKWLKLAAENGHTLAQTNLGIVYFFGDTGEQSYEKAFSNFSRAAKGGDSSAS